MEANVRREPYRSQAQAVATETMRRVRRNCERIISRLQRFGYIFGTFTDGTHHSYRVAPLTPPSDRMRADRQELESQAGQLPLSLTTFWQEIGAVDRIGMHPAWPNRLDPPEGPLSDLFDEGEGIFVALAPDDLHKDNTSGGDPYGL